MQMNLKKMAATIALTTTLFTGAQMGAAKNADAMMIGIGTGNVLMGGAGFVFIVAGIGAGQKANSPGLLVTGAVIGLLLEENASPVQVLPNDVTEQVNLGIYTEAEGAEISAELAQLDAQHEQAVKIAVQGKSSEQIRAEIARELNISDLTAGYITARAGIQTE